jgi:hypothetical protein
MERNDLKKKIQREINRHEAIQITKFLGHIKKINYFFLARRRDGTDLIWVPQGTNLAFLGLVKDGHIIH